MKTILIDLTKIKNIYSGLGQFSMNFANQLVEDIPSEFEVDFLVSGQGVAPHWKNKVNVVKSSLTKRWMPSTHKSYDVWHSLHQFPSFPPNKHAKWILTVHDLNFLVEKSGTKRKRYLDRLQKDIDKAHVVTTISHFTKNELIRHVDTGDTAVEVIHNGVATGKEIEKIKPDFIGRRKFFFSIGIFGKKKNFEVLLPLMKHFEDHVLVLAGNKDTAYGAEIVRKIAEKNLTNRVVLPGKISEGHKQWLYAHCEAFLFPSVAEGFGLPIVEAMHEGKPVFASKFGSLLEIGGDMAFYFDDFDPDKMAATMRFNLEYVDKNCEEFEATSKRFAAKYSWRNCISDYVRLYQSIVDPSVSAR